VRFLLGRCRVIRYRVLQGVARPQRTQRQAKRQEGYNKAGCSCRAIEQQRLTSPPCVREARRAFAAASTRPRNACPGGARASQRPLKPHARPTQAGGSTRPSNRTGAPGTAPDKAKELTSAGIVGPRGHDVHFCSRGGSGFTHRTRRLRVRACTVTSVTEFSESVGCILGEGPLCPVNWKGSTAQRAAP
jgi:hypothetical protein